jgi:hypothetical protein
LPVHAVRSSPLLRPGRDPGVSAVVVWTSSPGVTKDRPSTVPSAGRPLPVPRPRTLLLRHVDATPRARAALAVSHDFGGLLRPSPCRSVAPCCRPWGSPRFGFPRGCCLAFALPRARAAPCLGAVPVTRHPSKPSPRQELLLRHRSRCLLAVPAGSGLGLSVLPRHPVDLGTSGRPQGVAPLSSPLPSLGVATKTRPDASLGLYSLQVPCS